jgi:NADH dehydrogenase
MTTSRPRRVLILGGGFGGVAVAQELERLLPKSGRPLDVTLISRDNYLLFVPMLAEAATGSIELPHILTPLRELLPRTRLRIEHVQSIDLQRQTVTTVLPSTHSEYVLEWDDLVIALGNVVNLVGLPGVAEHGLPIKTIGDALHVRNRTVEMLEGAENQTDPVERRRLLTFVVAGGGFSGVEVAAELNDFLREAERAYPTVTAADVRVIVLHSGDRILPELSPGLAAFAQRKLAERGVEIRLGQRLAAATAHEVVLQSGERIDAHTLIVAIGAGQNPALQNLGLPVEHGRLQTDALLRVRGQEHVWALGDCAAVPDPHLGGQACPPTAQFALRQGRTLAYNLVAATRGRPLRAFRFGGLGQLVSLGHRSAVAELPFGLKVAGLPAWLMWRSFYLFRLPGLERKLRVSLDWSLDLLFRRDLVELNVERTERVALAHYEPGQVIIRQGDLADSFYVLVNGEVQVVREEPGGERELARMQPGDIFGEMGLLRQERRNATVRAVGRVDVLMLGQQDFQMLAKTWKHLGKLVEDVAASRDGGPPGSGSEVWGPSPEGPSTGADDSATTAMPPG